MNKVRAVILTLFVGYIGTAPGDELMNWPQLGPILAVVCMGCFSGMPWKGKRTGRIPEKANNRFSNCIDA